MTTSRGTISVITCTHDPGVSLVAFAEKLRGLASWADRVVLVDDASRDGSQGALRRVADEFENIVFVELPTNVGVARARNVALSLCDTDWVWFVDDDDDWPDDVGAVLRAATATDADIVQFRAEYCPTHGDPVRVVDGLDEERTVSGEQGRSALLDGTIGGFLWSKLIRRQVLGQDPFPSISAHSDVVGTARALSAARQVAFRSEVVYRYVHTPGSVSRRRDPDWGALEHACHRVLDLVGHEASRADRTLFVATFLCRALLRTPVRTRVSREAKHEAAVMLRSTWQELDHEIVRERAPSLWAILTIGSRSASTARAIYAMAYIVLDGARWSRRAVGSLARAGIRG
jgi:glycosyltransferase involved in cell wall biosynthesis